jgi:hypothetical protein
MGIIAEQADTWDFIPPIIANTVANMGDGAHFMKVDTSSLDHIWVIGHPPSIFP